MEGNSFAQQAEAAEAAWLNKRHQRGHRRPGAGHSNQPTATFTNSTSAQGGLESLTSTQASSLLSLSLSASLQEIDSASLLAEGNHPSGIPPVSPSAPSPRNTQHSHDRSTHSAANGEEGEPGRARIFPCHSDSDWYSSILPPLCGAGTMGVYRCGPLMLSKVPRSLRSMVRSWQKVQQWVQTAGLEGTAEPWLCIVARLSDTGAFESLMQSLLPTKVSYR